jgi:hypothetical protein
MSENSNQDRANFRMIYEQLSERTKKENMLPLSLNNTIKQLSANVVKRLDDKTAQRGF